MCKPRFGQPRSLFAKREVLCPECQTPFMQWPSNQKPKFCSVACCRAAMSKLFSKQEVRKCQHCGGEFKTITSPSRKAEKRDRYCSQACGWMARRKHWYEPCVRCGSPMRVKPSDKKFHAKKYCSSECYWMTVRESEDMRRAPRKDNNHDEIAELFEAAGFGVYDTSATGRGMPDMAVWLGQVVKLIEIKNPKTSYGRKGLNANQKRLIEGKKFPVSVITGTEEALEFIRLFKGMKADRDRNNFIYPQDKPSTEVA